MNESKSMTNVRPALGLDRDTRELVSIVVNSRVDDPDVVEEILRAVLPRLNNTDFQAIRHRNEYIAVVVDRAIFAWLRRDARAQGAFNLQDASLREGSLADLKLVFRWLARLSLVLSCSIGTYIWTWRLLDPIRRQFLGPHFGSSPLELLLIAAVSMVAVVVGARLGLLAARYGEAE